MRFWLILVGMGLTVLPVGAAEIGTGDLASLPPANVVILGEVHDNPTHHANQAQAVAALAPRALVFEMLTPEQAAIATPALRADPVALGTALGWEAAGWPDFAMYAPIFTAGPGAAIFGGALSRAVVRQAVRDGAAAVFGDDAASYGLTTPLVPADQAAREAAQQAAHCNALPETILPGMVQAQRLRDAALARAIVQAVAATSGPVAVITGTGHARRDEGIPAVLSLAAPNLRVLSVGQAEAPLPADAPFDLWLVTPPAPREDPCAGFTPPKG